MEWIRLSVGWVGYLPDMDRKRSGTGFQMPRNNDFP